jgi:hypothetical protein
LPALKRNVRDERQNILRGNMKEKGDIKIIENRIGTGQNFEI